MWPVTVATALVAKNAPGSDVSHARVTLDWSSADGCIDAASLRAKTQEVLGYEAFVDGGAEYEVIGHAGKTGGSFLAEIVFRRAGGETLGTRTLTANEPDCAKLSSGLPLALALVVDLSLRQAAIRGETHAGAVDVLPRPAAPNVDASETPPLEPPRPTPTVGSRAVVATDVGFLLRAGSLPRRAEGFRVSFARTQDGMTFGVEGSWLAPQIESDHTLSASVWSFGGATFACPWSRTASIFAWSACGMAEVGAAVANGVQIPTPRSDLAFIAAAGVRAHAGVHLGRPWMVGVEATVAAFLVRPDLTYNQGQVLVSASRGFLDMSLFFGLRAP